jgi:hypothetical protein
MLQIIYPNAKFQGAKYDFSPYLLSSGSIDRFGGNIIN